MRQNLLGNHSSQDSRRTDFEGLGRCRVQIASASAIEQSTSLTHQNVQDFFRTEKEEEPHPLNRSIRYTRPVMI